MLDQLLISKVRVKMLKYFLFNQDKPIHVRGLVRKLDEEINAVRRELRNLDDIGILNSKKNGNKLEYKLNTNTAGVNELYSLFVLEIPEIKDIFRKLTANGNIKVALLTPNYFTKKHPDNNDVDMLLVGDINPNEIHTLIKDLESLAKQDLRVAALKSEEVPFYLKKRDDMLMNILSKDTINLIGTPATLYRI